MEVYLKNTELLDFENEALSKYALDIAKDGKDLKTKAILIFESVRDGLRYNGYHTSLQKEDFRASEIFKRKEGHCVDKAILLTACLRKNNIPARIGFSKVRNHIATEKFAAHMGTDIMSPHGHVELFLDNRWLKVVPAFNKSLCEKLNVDILEFDGDNDAIFQSFDKKKKMFMEYLEDFGTFEEVPFQFIMAKFRETYPKLFAERINDNEIGLKI